MPSTKTRVVRLQSTEGINAAGMLAWAMNAYKFKRDRSKMIKVMESWPGLSKKQWRGVLSGEIPHKVVDDEVDIELPVED